MEYRSNNSGNNSINSGPLYGNSNERSRLYIYGSKNTYGECLAYGKYHRSARHLHRWLINIYSRWRHGLCVEHYCYHSSDNCEHSRHI